MLKNLILVTVSGPDKPGITAALMRIISDSKGLIHDMGQSVTHGLLSLSILMDTGTVERNASPILKDLLFEAKKMGLELEFEVIPEEDSPIVNGHELDKFILSCVAPERIPTAFMADIANVLATNRINIQRIDNVTPTTFRTLEIQTAAEPGLDEKQIKLDIMKVGMNHAVDVCFIRDNVFRRNKRLIVFDMDSTLIQSEVIVDLAEKNGAGKEVHEITERAMNGELDFDESLKLRVAQLKGLSQDQLEIVMDNLKFTPGTELVLKTLKNLGYKIAIISGGFTYFANAIKEKFNLDYAFANELDIRGGKLTGQVSGTVVNAEQKAFLLDLIAQQENISLEQVVAIGDGANDLPMLSKAGLGIAFHAKEIVKKQADTHMSFGPMTSILFFLGIPSSQHLDRVDNISSIRG